MNDCIWIDRLNALFRYIHFVLSYGSPCGKNLAIQIGQAYPVIVDKILRSNVPTPLRASASTV